MAETGTMARPYARAVFEIAQQADALQAWSKGLAAVAAIVANDDVERIIGSPMISDEKLADSIIGIAADDLPAHGADYVRLLVDNDRLQLAPAIAAQFDVMRAAAEQRVGVSVTSAVEFSEKQKLDLAQSLQQRLSATVDLSFEQDDSILGGAVIRAGDLVIDRSVRAQLDRMQQSLTQ